MSHQPLVSVIVPTYNCATCIGEAIKSVLSQTYGTFEIIVVDDGSTDDTKAVLAPFASRIKYLYQQNQGQAAARNAGIRQTRGEFLAFLDADDIWFPAKLALQVQGFRNHPEAGLAFTDFLDFDESSVTGSSRFDTWPGVRAWFDRHRVGDSEIACGPMYEELLQGNWIHTSSTLVRRNVMNAVGLFDEALHGPEDYDQWLRIAKNYHVLCVDRVLTGYRYRPQSHSGAEESRGAYFHQGSLRVLEKHLRNKWVPHVLDDLVHKKLRHHCWGLGWALFGQNRFAEARRFLSQGIRYQPFNRRLWIYWWASFLPLPAIEAARRFLRWRRSVRLHAEPTARDLAITPSGPEGRRRTI